MLIDLAFKAGTGDIRRSASVHLARRLIDDGHAFDIFEFLLASTTAHRHADADVLERNVDEAVLSGRRYDAMILTRRLHAGPMSMPTSSSILQPSCPDPS